MGRLRLKPLEGGKQREKYFNYITISTIKRIKKIDELFTILS